MGTSNSSADLWPQDAAPRHWVAALFEKMARMWGNTFLDKWRDTDLEGVMVEWGKGLRKLSTSELKAGVDALLTLKFPPNLPEFYALCKARRLVEAATETVKLNDQTRADPERVEQCLAGMRRVSAAFTQAKEPTAEWAFRLLIRGGTPSGALLSASVVKCAYDAICSSAGRRAVENASGEDRETFSDLYRSCVEGARNAGQRLWETP
ncbi:hypothetical protein [Paraburkholderia caballeronis]|uniref:hypothetical protein n=1 Tax=Paraburkholderia caballeronis TaxID=416943 RepID=UPI001064D8F3|nr:hypothetical protein [Paraburkholderia caballeronis]TDV06042.1 hypothetical protein C7408_12423 [Paraburkholderia caballeronis]TDV09582.1 hypothetical protein C7406_12623 [Paraburkholderia caballeronis]TDV21647.1 hypothetical protein C7404_12123 [Paraburkholderia caballeronis]